MLQPPDRKTPSPRRVRIHFHVLFKGLLEYQEHFEQDWTFFCFCCGSFFFFFFHPFLADGVGGSSDVGEVRDTAAFSPTAQSSLKRPGPEYLVCSRSTGGSADFTFHYLMALRFDSLLPVSVKAELNVNQGPGREEHECKQIEPRAAQVGGTLSTERKGKERKGKERKGKEGVGSAEFPRPGGSVHTTLR